MSNIGRNPADWSEFNATSDYQLEIEVPIEMSILPDGRSMNVAGYPDLWPVDAPSADASDGFSLLPTTSGLQLCAWQMSRFEVDITTDELTRHAVEGGYCELDSSGRMLTTPSLAMMPSLLGEFGVPAHVELGQSLEDLAQNIENGAGVIVYLNDATLGHDNYLGNSGEADHLVGVLRVARDPASYEISGFYIHDSTAESSFVAADSMIQSWLDAGGLQIITDATYRSAN